MTLNLNNITSNMSDNSGMTAPLLEQGGYPGRLVQVIDLGLHPNSFQNQEKPPAHKVRLTYEFADEFMQDEDGNDIEDKPRWLSEEINVFSLQSERAKSTQRYAVLDPNGDAEGDLAKCIGNPCLITVVHNPGSGKNTGRVFENIGGISTLRSKDAKKVPELRNEPKVFDLDDPDYDVFISLPQFVRDKITSNLEFKGSALEKLLNEKGYDPSVTKKSEVVEEEDNDTDEAPF